MQLKNIYLQGADGRMGALVAELAQAEKINVFKSLGAPKSGSVLIDFSSPEGFLEAAKWCAKNKMPIVSGTTGFSEKEHKTLSELSKKVPVLWSANMSLGVYIMKSMLKKLALGQSEYDFHIEEIHHKHKKDAPSGTALSLQLEMQSHLKKKKVTVSAIRGGGVFGVHKVFGLGEEEVLILEHQALSRKVFARGAIKCAQWLVAQKSGSYDLGDVLGISQ